MKTKLLSLLAGLAAAAHAAQDVTLIVDTNGTLRAPTNFLTANSNALRTASPLPSVLVRPGSNVTITTNNAGQINEYLSVASTGGGGGGAYGMVSPTNVLTRTNWWAMDEWGGAADADATMQTIFARIHASGGGSDLGGTMWFSPKTTYTFDNTVSLYSGASSGIPSAQFGYGNFAVRADPTARLVMTANTNLLLITGNNFRHVIVEGGNYQGSNNGRTNNTSHIGLFWNGASGQAKARELTFTGFGVGMVLNDITGFEANNVIAISNFIGIASGYKPDGVVLRDCRVDRNEYGIWTHWTNGLATTVSAVAGNLVIDNCVLGVNTRAGILHGKGPLHIKHAYGEANGTNNHYLTMLQLGYNPDDAYESSFTNYSAQPPDVTIDSWDFNFKHAITAFTRSIVRLGGFNEFSNARPYVVLRTTDADNSTIIPDRLLVVTNSANTQIIVPFGYAYVSNQVVPKSGMSLSNLTDFSNSAQLSSKLGDETGSGEVVFSTTPTITDGRLRSISGTAALTLTKNHAAAGPLIATAGDGGVEVMRLDNNGTLSLGLSAAGYYGLVPSGALTNAGGFRVAYINDTSLAGDINIVLNNGNDAAGESLIGVATLSATNIYTHRLWNTNEVGYVPPPTNAPSVGQTVTATSASTAKWSEYQFVTNSINTGVIPVGKTTYTNLTGNITIAGFSGVDLNFNQWAKIKATNSTSTDWKITFDASVFPSTNAFVVGQDFWVSNRTMLTIMVDIDALSTNAAAVRFSK